MFVYPFVSNLIEPIPFFIKKLSKIKFKTD